MLNNLLLTLKFKFNILKYQHKMSFHRRHIMLKIIYNLLMKLHRIVTGEPPFSHEEARIFVINNMYGVVQRQKKLDINEYIIELIIASESSAAIHPRFYPNFQFRHARKLEMEHIEKGKKIRLKLNSVYPADKLDIVYNGFDGKYKVKIIPILTGSTSLY